MCLIIYISAQIEAFVYMQQDLHVVLLEKVGLAGRRAQATTRKHPKELKQPHYRIKVHAMRAVTSHWTIQSVLKRYT